AAAQGKGAATLDGRLIDSASARMANNVVEVAEAISVKNSR
ncbi:MAG: CoA ester lyase, partial [Betaproteobacteria bacterium]